MTFAETQFQLPDLLPASAELFMVFMIGIALFVRDGRRTLSHLLAQGALFGAAALTLAVGGLGGGGEIAPDRTTGIFNAFLTFSGLFITDAMADLFKLSLYLAVGLALGYSRAFHAKKPALFSGDYYALALMATLGMMVMVSANHFVTLYIGLELLSLPLYALIALDRDSGRAAESSMKYFVLGALSSGLLLYGISMIYGATGSLSLSAVAASLSGPGNADDRVIAGLGLVFLVSGMVFKLGLAPFHMWAPDVYHGAPTPVVLLIAGAPKIAVFALLVRVLLNGLPALAPDWSVMLLFISLLSIALGNIAALVQTNIKRMLAYSSIAQMGFMLLGVVFCMIEGHTPNRINASTASLFYLFTYTLAVVGAFGVVSLLPDSGEEDAGEIVRFSGLFQTNPLLAVVMASLMFSMAGIPFFVGFFAKFSVLVATVASGYFWVAVFAAFFSLIGAYYYLRIVKVMFFDEAKAPHDDAPRPAPIGLRALAAANGLAVAWLGLFPNGLMRLCFNALARSIGSSAL